jgi:hypothetical protein
MQILRNEVGLQLDLQRKVYNISNVIRQKVYQSILFICLNFKFPNKLLMMCLKQLRGADIVDNDSFSRATIIRSITVVKVLTLRMCEKLGSAD